MWIHGESTARARFPAGFWTPFTFLARDRLRVVIRSDYASAGRTASVDISGQIDVAANRAYIEFQYETQVTPDLNLPWVVSHTRTGRVTQRLRLGSADDLPVRATL